MLVLQLPAARIHEQLERGELRQDAGLPGGRVPVVELVDGVDLGVELVCLDRRALEPERLRAIRPAFGTDRLGLQRAAQRLGVVLQRDHADDPAGVGLDERDPAVEDLR